MKRKKRGVGGGGVGLGGVPALVRDFSFLLVNLDRTLAHPEQSAGFPLPR